MLSADADTHPDDADTHRPRIHFLGVGNIGTFVAHGLASIPYPPQITLMLHHPVHYKVFESIGRRLIVQRHGLSEHKGPFDVNYLDGDVWYHAVRAPKAEDAENPEEHLSREGKPLPRVTTSVDDSLIDHLVVSAKAVNVRGALESVKHRLGPQSTVVFLHNGMGVLEDVNTYVFPDPATRPSYISGIISHGLYRFKYFNVVYNGAGTTTLGVAYTNPHVARATMSPNNTTTESESAPPGGGTKSPISDYSRRGGGESVSLSTSYLLHTFARSPFLLPHITNKTDTQLFQLEKLVINALINPLAVVNDCTNGQLLDNDKVLRAQRLLLHEICGVIWALPELRSVPGIRARFAPDRLLDLTHKVAEQTATNTCSMLQDVTRGRMTEINYINGYIVRRGDELGITCALNYLLMDLVKGKSQVMAQREEAHAPMEDGVLVPDVR